MNATRPRPAAGSFSVPVGAGTDVTAIGFHDIAYHSGDGIGGINFDGTDWPAEQVEQLLVWSTEDFSVNPNANAIRWGTLYNFSFTADVAPITGAITVGLFKPGEPEAMTVAALIPGPPPPVCPGDTDGSGVVDVNDLNNIILDWGTDGSAHQADVDGSGVVDVGDLVEVILGWGAC